MTHFDEILIDKWGDGVSVGYIPNDVLEQVQASNDIVSVIGEYVQLKKAGANYTGLCPFHNEKTPSFSVSPSKQIFYCFGCGTGGNVFKFIMLIENLTFVEAVEKLAKRSGIKLPEKELTKAEKDALKRKERLFRINDVTARYYQKVLRETKEGIPYLQYLKNRGMSDEVIEKFGLGASVSGWDNLSRFLKSKGITEQEMIDLGLALPRKERDGCFDRFRERVMFPIRDEKGRVVAFGGRVIDPLIKQQKYMNSPDTPLFNKGKMLYGLDMAKSAIRSEDGAILVEGYMDVISCHQFGIKNVVAPLGTSFTQEQAKLIMKNSYRIYVSFDGDSAGIKASMRSLEILNNLNCNVRVLTIPNGNDPDEFLKKYGKEAFLGVISHSREYLVYKMDTLLEKININDISGKSEVVKELLPDLKKLKSAVALDSAVDMISDKLQISKKAVLVEMRGERHYQQADEVKNADNLLKKKNNKQYMAEALMIATLSENDEIFSVLEAKGGVNLFVSELRDYYLEYVNNGSFLNKEALNGIVMLCNEHNDDFNERLRFLQGAYYDRRYNELLKKIQTNEKMGATDDMLSLLKELEEVRKSKEKLANERGTL